MSCCSTFSKNPKLAEDAQNPKDLDSTNWSNRETSRVGKGAPQGLPGATVTSRDWSRASCTRWAGTLIQRAREILTGPQSLWAWCRHSTRAAWRCQKEQDGWDGRPEQLRLARWGWLSFCVFEDWLKFRSPAPCVGGMEDLELHNALKSWTCISLGSNHSLSSHAKWKHTSMQNLHRKSCGKL